VNEYIFFVCLIFAIFADLVTTVTVPYKPTLKRKKMQYRSSNTLTLHGLLRRNTEEKNFQ
jgi:hypothetical protein